MLHLTCTLKSTRVYSLICGPRISEEPDPLFPSGLVPAPAQRHAIRHCLGVSVEFRLHTFTSPAGLMSLPQQRAASSRESQNNSKQARVQTLLHIWFEAWGEQPDYPDGIKWPRFDGQNLFAESRYSGSSVEQRPAQPSPSRRSALTSPPSTCG